MIAQFNSTSTMSAKSRKQNDQLNRREFLCETAVATAGLVAGVPALRAAEAQPGARPLNYNPDMEYRRLGKTGLQISAVCLGGHWKRIDTVASGGTDSPDFQKNRYDVVTRCLERGINYIDACTGSEVIVYSRALKGRRDKMHLGFSWFEEEMRNPECRTTAKLLAALDKGMKQAGLDYVDLWRVTLLEQSGQHTPAEVEALMKALETAKQQGKARFTGFSSHDRPHIKWMVETYPQIVDVVCTPYTARTKVLPTDSLFEAVRQQDVGVFGIKPFASNSLFKGSSALNHPMATEDSRIARLAIRNILGNPAITAPIPGLINLEQVDNVAKAVQERRQLDRNEQGDLERAGARMWARLPHDYQWLREFEYV
jgi:predicted aldo/keto reductase-like oxidoreductase